MPNTEPHYWMLLVNQAEGPVNDRKLVGFGPFEEENLDSMMADISWSAGPDEGEGEPYHVRMVAVVPMYDFLEETIVESEILEKIKQILREDQEG